MQGKYRIYIAYCIVMIIGILLYLFFIFFLEYKVKDKPEIAINQKVDLPSSKNKNIGIDATSTINKNIDAIEPTIPDNSNTIPDIASDIPIENMANLQEPNNSLENNENTNINITENITPTTPEVEKDTEKIYSVKSRILNIREKPNTESKIIKQYAQDDNIIITNIKDDWGELKSGGFVYMELLKENDNPNVLIAPDDGIKIYTVKARILNIREKPNTESKIIKQYAQDDNIIITNIKDDWGEIKSGGFVYMELLKESD